MNKFSRIILISVFSLAAIFLAACNAALPVGAEASVSQDGQSAQVEFTGVVDSISANQWVVSGQTLLVNAQTIIDGVFAAGDPVKVYATITSDGAVTANKLESPSADDFSIKFRSTRNRYPVHSMIAEMSTLVLLKRSTLTLGR